MLSRRSRRSKPIDRVRFLVCAVSMIALAVAATIPAHARTVSQRATAAAPKPGAWIQFGAAQGLTTPALLHVAGGNDLLVWQPVSTTPHYEAVELKPAGGKASAANDVFAGKDWSSVAADPALISDNGKPLLVFSGQRALSVNDRYADGCVVGALRSPTGWKLQNWSLSQGCTFADVGFGGATRTRNGTLSAVWAGGGVMYHIGASTTIPASTPDRTISTSLGDAESVNEQTDSKSQDLYAVWYRTFSKPPSRDGVYVADVTKKGPPMKGPSSGTNDASHSVQPVAVASPSGRGGIYLAYCNNASPCNQVELWRAGAKKAVAVPKSSAPTSVALSAGPSGRLWLAWWSAKNGTVRVVRTNKAGSRFGPVETLSAPHGCAGDTNAPVVISSGPQQRLDVVLNCYDYASKKGAVHISATQSLVSLQLRATASFISHRKNRVVTYRVADAGDAVTGATVGVDGRKGRTNKKGQITFHFAKGSKTGTFRVTASIKNYLNASILLRID